MINQANIAFKQITDRIDWLNDKLTSYRLVLYLLIALLAWAVFGSFGHNVPFNWHQILVSAGFLLAVCWAVNKAVARFLNIPANKESDLITALILALILTPPSTGKDFIFVGAAGAAAIISKFVIVLSRSHIFNPAAAGAFVAGEIFHYYPAWWVGTKFMTPVVVIGGILILRKMHRFTMVAVFLAVFLLYLIYGTSLGSNLHFLWLELISTQVLFFAVVMLSEPLTSPTELQRSLAYSGLVAILYTANKLKFTPEEALLAGNLFTFLIARNKRYQLKFVRRVKEAREIYSYMFAMPKGFKFQAGQYMEWTINQNKTDSRGNRRYLTISSSPAEPGLMFTVRHPEKASPVESALPAGSKPAFHGASAFKQKLEQLKPDHTILGGHLAGDFTLPKDQTKKLAFLAGGIGVTPFRSMIGEMLKDGQARDAVLIYSANTEDQIAFKDYFAKAADNGLRTEYVIKDPLDEKKLAKLLPDLRQRRIYVSGPIGYVNAVETALLKLGASSSNIVTDYFPGYGN